MGRRKHGARTSPVACTPRCGNKAAGRDSAPALQAYTWIHWTNNRAFLREAQAALNRQETDIRNLAVGAIKNGFSGLPRLPLHIKVTVEDDRKNPTNPLPPIADRQVVIE